MLVGYHAKKIIAADEVTYCVTVNRGSLTQRRDFEVMMARLGVDLRRNKFLKEHGLGHRQGSIMYRLYEARHYSMRERWQMIRLIIRYHQNPFVGWQNWWHTFRETKKREKELARYIVR